MQDERHMSLKRWERARQYEGLRKETALSGPAAWCRFKAAFPRAEEGPADARLPVFIVAMFENDFTCVRACHEPAPAGVPGPCWLTAGAIAWSEYLPAIVRHYRAGLSVPAAFAPRRKLGEDLLLHLEALPGRELPGIFRELRRAGLLPPLLALSRATCPEGLPWDQLRALFQDFRTAVPARATHG